MAAEDVIDHYISRQGIKEDTDFIIQNLNKVFDEFQKIKGLKIELKAADGTSATIAAVNQVAQAQANFNNQVKQTVTWLQFVKERMSAAMKETGSHAAAMKKLSEEYQQYKNTVGGAAKALDDATKAQQNKNKVTEQSEKLAAQEKKIIDQIANEYGLLSKAYNEASLKAKNYAITLGEQHPITLQAVKDANDLGNYLKRIDASVGQYQRNVGNYSSAFNGLHIATQQIIREAPTLAISFQMFALAVSNNLPILFDAIQQAKAKNTELVKSGEKSVGVWTQIGKSIFSAAGIITIAITLFTLFSGKIAAWVSKLFEGADAVDALKKKLDQLTDSADRTKSAIQNINTEIDFLAQKKSLEIDLQFSGDETTAGVKKAASELDFLMLKNKELQNVNTQSARERKAALDVTLGLLTRADKEFLVRQKNLNVTDQLTLKFKNVTGALVSLTEAELNNLSDVGKEAVRNLKTVAGAESEVNDTIRKNKQDIELQNIRVKLSEKQLNEERYKKSKELAERNLSAIFELQKLYAQKEIDLQKAISEGDTGADKAGENIRLAARKSQLDAEFDLIEIERKKEVSVKDKTEAEIILINEQALEKRREAEARYAADIIKIRSLTEKAAREEAKNTQETLNDTIAKNLQKKIDDETEFSTSRQNRYQRESDEELTALNTRYAAGKISKEKYEEDKLRIETEYLRKSLREQIRYQKALVELYETDPKKREEALTKIAELERKLSEAGIKDADKKKEKDLKYYADLKTRLVELGNEINNTVFSLFESAIDRRKNALQEEIDLLEKRKQKEIEAVTQSLRSEQDKAAAIQIIQARAAAQREQLEQRQRQLDQQKARFEKQKAIVDIISNTAVAIIKTLKEYPGPHGITLAAIIGAIGAAQLARTIAQPIPKYAKGTKDHPGGLAVVGDGGRSELVVTPDGKMMKTPATDTVVDLPAKTVVYPDYQKAIQNIAFSEGAKIMGYSPKSEITNAVDPKTFKKEIRSLGDIIKNKKETHIKIENPLKQWIRQGESWTDYLNRN